MKKQALSLILTLFSIGALACGPFAWGYKAKDYTLFKIVELEQKVEQEEKSQNCKDWHRLFPTCYERDIYKVVYEWSEKELRQLKKKGTKRNKKAKGNSFARALQSKKGRAALDYLLLTKEYLGIRQKQTDVWYYWYRDDVYNQRLREIAEIAANYSGKQLTERYLLLQIRAMFASRNYEECISLWTERKKELKNNMLHKTAAGLVANAYLNRGDSLTAKNLYSQINDEDSYYNCLNAKEKSEYDFKQRLTSSATSPNSYRLFERVVSEVSNLEEYLKEDFLGKPDPEYVKEELKRKEPIYETIQQIANEHKAEDMALWYYIAAFTSDIYGDHAKARRYISKAKKCKATDEQKDYLRVLEFYITVKYQKDYTPKFEQYVLKELKWLDRKIKTDMTAEEQKLIKEYGDYYHLCGFGVQYWDDMMRKMTIGYIAPLCIKAGKEVKALQYLNMADHSIFKIVPSKAIWSPNHGNAHNNYYFCCLDSMPARVVQQYTHKLKHPESALDSFLTHRSYTDSQYLNDIIGTLLIREMKYNEAAKYLGRVSKKFNKQQDIQYYYKFDPFTSKKLKTKDSHYKLHFAQKMYKLERKIIKATNPDTKAELMLQYAKGLQNSCNEFAWALTSYYNGEYWNYPFYSKRMTSKLEAIRRKSTEMRGKAFAMFTNEERKAQAYYDWEMYRTVATEYANTKIGKFVSAKCDKLIDYSPNKDPNNVKHWIRQSWE